MKQKELKITFLIVRPGAVAQLEERVVRNDEVVGSNPIGSIFISFSQGIMEESLLEKYTFLTKRPSSDIPAVNCPAQELVPFMRALRDKQGMDMLLDVTAIDWEKESPRYTCVYHLTSTENHFYLRVAANCNDDKLPTIPSLVEIWPAADWHERETFDMFGIRFEGHPNLKRILMWDAYPHFPLRKDFPLAGIEEPFPAADVAEVTKAKVLPAPMVGGPFRSNPKGSIASSEPRACDESWNEQSPKPKDTVT